MSAHRMNRTSFSKIESTYSMFRKRSSSLLFGPGLGTTRTGGAKTTDIFTGSIRELPGQRRPCRDKAFHHSVSWCPPVEVARAVTLFSLVFFLTGIVGLSVRWHLILPLPNHQSDRRKFRTIWSCECPWGWKGHSIFLLPLSTSTENFIWKRKISLLR